MASAAGLGSCLLQWLQSPSTSANDQSVAERSAGRFELVRAWGENMRRDDNA